MRLEIGVRPEQDHAAGMAAKGIGPVGSASRPVDQDEVGIGWDGRRRVDAGELDTGDTGGGLDPAVQHEVGDDRGDPHSGEASACCGAIGCGDAIGSSGPEAGAYPWPFAWPLWPAAWSMTKRAIRIG